MRFICFAFVCAFTAFIAVQPAVAQDNADGEPQQAVPSNKSVGDHIEAVGKQISGPRSRTPTMPHLRDGQTPHNNQWDDADWRPEYWVEDKGSVEAVINGFYDSGVIVAQYEDDVPVLEVGKPFLRLSPPDQRHVIEFINYAYKVTEKQSHGVFYIVIQGEDDKELLGLYSKHGLQLQ